MMVSSTRCMTVSKSLKLMAPQQNVVDMSECVVETEKEGACAGNRWGKDEDVNVVDGIGDRSSSGIGLVGKGNDGGGSAGQRRRGQRSGRCV